MSNNLEDFRKNLLACLGGDWPEPVDLEPEVEDSIPREGYRLEKVTYRVESGERVGAYVLLPDGVNSESPAPGGGSGMVNWRRMRSTLVWIPVHSLINTCSDPFF